MFENKCFLLEFDFDSANVLLKFPLSFSKNPNIRIEKRNSLSANHIICSCPVFSPMCSARFFSYNFYSVACLNILWDLTECRVFFVQPCISGNRTLMHLTYFTNTHTHSHTYTDKTRYNLTGIKFYLLFISLTSKKSTIFVAILWSN